VGRHFRRTNDPPSFSPHDALMADYVTSLGMILVLMKQMETSVLQLRHLREYVTAEVSAGSLDAAIVEGEMRIADAKRKIGLSLTAQVH